MSFIFLLVCGVLGLAAHWYKKWARKEIELNFIEYMKNNRKYSIGSVVTLIAAIVTMYITGDVEVTKQTLGMAFMAGYGIDSAVNKSEGD